MVLILSKKSCVYTHRLKTLLEMCSIPYEHCIVENTTSELLKKKINYGPIVYTSKGYYGTYEDVTSAYLKGKMYDDLQENDKTRIHELP